MRKKIGKRIGPVPITLVAALALAAFLSAGLLLAPNGAPTAEAQSADCTVTVGKDRKASLPADCEAQGDTATVVFERADDVESTDWEAKDGIAGEATLSLLIEDPAGPITAYPYGTTVKENVFTVRVSGTSVTATTMRYRFESITVLSEDVINPSSGSAEKQKVSVMVEGDVYIWTGVRSVTSPIKEDGDNKEIAKQIAMGSQPLQITLLGNPAIGEDSANDRNTIVDDFKQCTLGENGTAEEGTMDPDGDMENCQPSVKGIEINKDNLDNDDVLESRSKLEVEIAPSDEDRLGTPDVSVIDGTEDNVTLDEESTVAIWATIKDAKGNPLNKVDVTFAATSVPANIENRTRSYDSVDEGVANHVISDLPTDKPYRVTVVVTAGEDNLEVGTIVIARAGDLDTVTATACAKVTTGETDIKMDGCMADYNPKMIYGQEDEFSIYAKATDNLGIKVTPDSFKVKPATMDGYGDATQAFNNLTAAGMPMKENNTVDLTVKANAPGAKYLLDVVATTGTGDDMITRNQQVKIIVSGDLAEYTLEGPAYIALNGNAMYTVTAMDENGNPPVFDTNEDKVRVLVQPNTVLVTGLTDNDLTLAETTGMGTFTVYAPLSAANGDLGRIIIGTGAMQVVENITFGMPNQAPMAGDAIADQMVTAGETAMVQSTITDPDLGDTLTWTVMSDMPMYATATVDSMGMVTITGVAEGMATITVTATDMDGAYDMQTIMVTVMMMPPMELGAPSITNVMSEAEGMATVMLTPGDNATKHWAWAAPTDGSAGMWHGDSALAGDATMVTFSGLTSGMNYWFIAIAGRGTGADSEWSAWSGWTAETPIQ